MGKTTYDRKENFEIKKAVVEVTAYDAAGTLETNKTQILYPKGAVTCTKTDEYYVFDSSTCEFPVKHKPNKCKIEGQFVVQDVNPAMENLFCGGTLTVEGTIGDAAAVGTPTLDDATSSGTFSGGANVTYTVEIVSSGTPDTYAVSWDGGDTWIESGVDCSDSFVEIHDGVTVSFGATSGHAVGDKWTIPVTGVKARNEQTLADTQPFQYGANIKLIDKDNSDLVTEITKADLIAETVEYGSDDANNKTLAVGFKAIQPGSSSAAFIKNGSTSAA